MKSYILFILLLIFGLANLQSQTLYSDKIYSREQITIKEDVVYAEIEPFGFLYEYLQNSDIISQDSQMVSLIEGWLGKKLQADIYSPPKDVPLRPLILFFHGGGFVLGNRNETVPKTFCREFARRGFITASVGYRQSGISELSLKRAGYSATQDARAAVRFFRKNAAKFGIDPDYIYTAGESTGAVVALHAAFLDQSELFSNLGLEIDKHLGCLDCIGVENEDPKPRAVFSISGGVVDLKIMDNNDIPVVLFHGTADRVINPKEGLPREELSKSYLNLKEQVKGALGIGELPKIDSLYGSALIYDRLQELRVESLYDPIPGVGHHLISSDRGTMRNTAQHIFSKISGYISSKLKYDAFIQGKTSAPYNAKIDYKSKDEAYKYIWTVDGGEILEDKGKSVTIKWKKGYDKGILKLTAVNDLGVLSSTAEHEVKLTEPSSGEKFNHWLHKENGFLIIGILGVMVLLILFIRFRRRN